jgi:serine/threonine protein kinase/sugar lactone lactonase YvrE
VSDDSASVADRFAPGLRVASYQLQEQIGRGGMAVVYRALDEGLHRQVALKILAPDVAANEAFRQRFIRESRAAAAVDDPHIIPIFQAGEADGLLFIAMRLVTGGDVRSLLAALRTLPPGRAAEIVSQIAGALDAAHALGLVHRDVKPANMLLDPVRSGRPDHVYLSDFGISKATAVASALTGTGQFIGTPDYIAPEQIQGGRVDGRTDQYALACAAFELLTGTPPFRRADTYSVLYAQISEPVPPVATRLGLRPAVDSVFARAMAKAPDDRYGDCSQFAAALSRALSVQTAAAAAAGVPAVADRGESWPLLPAAESGPPTLAQPRPPDRSLGEARVPVPRKPAPDLPFETVPGARSPVAQPATRRRRGGVLAGTFAAAVLIAGAAVAAVALSGAPGANHKGGHGGGHGSGLPTLPSYRPGRVLTDGVAGSIVEGAAFSPTGGYLAVADDNGQTYVWNSTSGRLIAMLNGLPGQGGVLAIAFSPDGKLLATAYKNDTINLWNARSLELLKTLDDPSGASGSQAVAFSSGGGQVAEGDAAGVVDAWSVRTYTQTNSILTQHAGSRGVQALAFSPDGKQLAMGTSAGTTYLYPLGSGAKGGALKDPDGSLGVQALAYAPDGTLAAADGDGSTYVWNTTTASIVHTLADPGSSGHGVVALDYGEDGALLATGDGNGSTYLWDTSNGALLKTLPGQRAGGVQAVAYSRNGKILAIGHVNGRTYLWLIGPQPA